MQCRIPHGTKSVCLSLLYLWGFLGLPYLLWWWHLKRTAELFHWLLLSLMFPSASAEGTLGRSPAGALPAPGAPYQPCAVSEPYSRDVGLDHAGKEVSARFLQTLLFVVRKYLGGNAVTLQALFLLKLLPTNLSIQQCIFSATITVVSAVWWYF